MANRILNFFKKIVGISTTDNDDKDDKDDKDDNTDPKMTIKKINLFINHSILLNYFDSYKKKNKNHNDNCNHIKTILSKKFYNKLNINDKEVVLLDTKFIKQRDKYKDEINILLSKEEKGDKEKAKKADKRKEKGGGEREGGGGEREGEGGEREGEGGEGEGGEREGEGGEREGGEREGGEREGGEREGGEEGEGGEREGGEEGEEEENDEQKIEELEEGVQKEEKFIKDSICEYINYIFYNYYVLLQAYYMFHNYKIVIKNENVSNEITETNIFFKFIKFLIDRTNIHGKNINGENINGENIKNINIKTDNETIDIKDFIDLLREDTYYNNDITITAFKCSVRNNAIEIIKNGKERLFFNKTFNYQLLNETNENEINEMENKFKQYNPSTREQIVNYGIKKQIIEFNKNHNNLINKNDTTNLCYLKEEILNLKIQLRNKLIKGKNKNYTVNLVNVETDIKKLIETYLNKKKELYENLIDNKIFNISDTNFKYIEDVILYDLHNNSLNTIKYNTEKIFYEFFIEFYKTLIKILNTIELTKAIKKEPTEPETETETETETKAPEPGEKATQEPASEPAPAQEPASKGGRKKIKTKRIKKLKRRKTIRKNLI